jgi:starvation-inducible DNA-binding protein
MSTAFKLERSDLPMRNDIGMEDDQRRRVARHLSRVLADSYVLLARTHGCHWNVVGPQFPGLHDLFETQYREIFGAIDEIAERIRALGYFAPANFGAMAREATIDVDETAEDAESMLEMLVADNEALARGCREVVEVCDQTDDSATEDLMNARIAAHDNHAWMVRACLPR